MPKIHPVLGVAPHEWHKYPPNVSEDQVKRENTRTRTATTTTATETIYRNGSDMSSVKVETEPEPVNQPSDRRVTPKQWTRSSNPNDPNRLGKATQGMPLRAAPSSRILEANGYDPEMLFPLAYDPNAARDQRPGHAHVESSHRQRAPDMQSHAQKAPFVKWNGDTSVIPPSFKWKSTRQQPDDDQVVTDAWRRYYAEHGVPFQPEHPAVQSQDANRVRSQETKVQPHIVSPQPPAASAHSQQNGSYYDRTSAWRDFAANPEPEKIGLPVRDFSGSSQGQSFGSSYEGAQIKYDQPVKGDGSAQSRKPTESDISRQPARATKGSEREDVSYADRRPVSVHEDENDEHSDTCDTVKPVKDTGARPIRRHHGPKIEPKEPQRQTVETPRDARSDQASDPVAPAGMRSPDLRQVRIPRPNQNYTRSERSVVSVLSLDEDNNARGDLNHMTLSGHSDIRHKIGLEPELRMSQAGRLIDTNVWSGRAREPNGEAFLDPVYANPWINDYVENQIDYDVCADFLYKVEPVVHCHSDVDTNSGELLSPVKYEYTVPDYMDSDDVDRQMTRSSSLYVQQRTGNQHQNGRRNNNNHGRNNSRGGSFRPRRNWTETPAPVTTSTPEPESWREQSQPKRESSPQKQTPTPASNGNDVVSDEEDPFAPRVQCHMRPAQMHDMVEVCAIYNWEVQNGMQALDTEPLSLAEWEGILKKTQDAKLPFVVVIRGAYQQQGKSALDNASDYPEDEVAGKVLAFGFLTVRQPGLAGSFDGTSRMSAQAMVFVHPGYRRKKLFHICIDKLLSTVSHRYGTKRGYEFVNHLDDPTYKYPWQHERKIYKVFVEYLVPRSLESDATRFLPDETYLTWFERVMTSRYGFWKSGRLEATHRSRRSYAPNPIWLDSVIFEHRCQEDLDFAQAL